MATRNLVFLLATVTASLVSLASEPVPLTAVNSEWVEKNPWLSPDGYTLYFSSNRDGGDFNIFETHWNSREWSPPVRLNSLINSEFDETQPSLSADGHWLLFVSFRGRFVRGPWISQRQPDGSWGKAHLVNGHREPEISQAIIGADGRSLFYTARVKGQPPKPYDTCMKYDTAQRFWQSPFLHRGEPPKNEIPGARWSFSAHNGDIYVKATGVRDPERGTEPERLNCVASSSLYGRENEDYWVTEAQNLVDGLEDTSWVSRKGKPVNKQWVLLALNGHVRYVPGLSRIHSLRFHAGPVEQVRIEKRQKKKPHSLYVEKVIPAESSQGTRP